MSLGRLINFPWYPFVLAGLPVLHFYQANLRLLRVTDTLRAAGLLCALAAVFLLLGRWAWKSWARSALVAAPLMAVVSKGNAMGGPVASGLVALAVLLAVGLSLRRFDPSKATLPLNMAALVLLVFPLVGIIQTERANQAPHPSAVFAREIDLPSAPGADVPPDIYFLLMDGLGQPDFLSRRFGIPRRNLASRLEGLGFRVLDRSLATYPQTALATAATFNLDTLQSLLEIADPESMDRRVLQDLIGDSRALRALRLRGYRTVTYPSGYPLTRLNKVDNRHEPLLNPSFLEYYVLEDGILPLIQPLLGFGPADLSYKMRRGRLEYIFDTLGQARKGVALEDPVFVFAHILAPHPPFVFDAAGRPLRSNTPFGFGDGSHWYDIHGRDGPDYGNLYNAQLNYIMGRTAQAVQAILAASPRPPVIIIQGDHGPGSRLNWERPLYTDHEERLGIFNAWYTPPGLLLDLQEDETALNTFPVLFNGIFGSELPRQPQRHWFARMSQPYTYFEVVK